MLCIGVGNWYRRDDAVGLVVANRLRDHAVLPTLLLDGEGATLLDAWQGQTEVILVDAVAADGVPGTLYRWDATQAPLPAQWRHYSSHAFGVAESIEMGRVLGLLPARLIIYGIEGADFSAGEGLTPAVAQTAEQLIQQIILASPHGDIR